MKLSFLANNQDASVAQWIERCPPEACAAVRLRSDAVFIYQDSFLTPKSPVIFESILAKMTGLFANGYSICIIKLLFTVCKNLFPEIWIKVIVL